MGDQVLRLYRFRFSTNVDRVTLALAHKGLEVESVWITYEDRSPVREVSGQELVPVLVHGDQVVVDSAAILEHLEARYPDPPLYPADPARREEVRVFIDWFNRVWKAEPNLVADAVDAGRGLDDPEVAAWAATVIRRTRAARGRRARSPCLPPRSGRRPRGRGAARRRRRRRSPECG